MLTIHLMEAHEFNPIESVSYKAELADSLSNDTSAAQGMFEFSRQNYFLIEIAIVIKNCIFESKLHFQ